MLRRGAGAVRSRVLCRWMGAGDDGKSTAALLKKYEGRTSQFYDYFNLMKFDDMEPLFSQDVTLRDSKKGSFEGRKSVALRLRRVRTKHGDEPWTVGKTEVFLNVPATKTKLQFRNEENKTLVTIITTLSFNSAEQIDVISTERIGVEPV